MAMTCKEGFSRNRKVRNVRAFADAMFEASDATGSDLEFIEQIP